MSNRKMVERNPAIGCARKIALEFNCDDEEKILTIAGFVRDALEDTLKYIKAVVGEMHSDLYPLCR